MDDEKGTLFIVSTPIGNTGDISSRAIDILGSVDAIACEDTRHSGQLLSRLGVRNRLIAYHDHNASKSASHLIALLNGGKDVALISDAGTPGISDPAYRVVREASDEGIVIQAIPGPSSLLAALVVSGLPLDRFVFEGFLPPKGAKRLKRIEQLTEETRTIVFFESPYRILALLTSLHDILGNRDVSVSRELTKMHEETVRGPVSDVIERIGAKKTRGEYTVVVRGLDRKSRSTKTE